MALIKIMNICKKMDLDCPFNHYNVCKAEMKCNAKREIIDTDAEKMESHVKFIKDAIINDKSQKLIELNKKLQKDFIEKIR